ncbi:dihydroxyacetone kinase phosphoryl donor subunit DhaM [Evansella tamaricis]|uniref:PTS-dependent dihydroxyacetone kinase phosphotransferase subunit DhaM n=1 Tax=Evansella tamaricis TaxID=2069301 RepID=A0ABS6JG29_9BACI|nr:dihydroxyacetone kinase phosphoryl donor subunit DhaM [Evansella tamaricis]MBU9712630.1 PTS-dependent dihydroxyacetone kinase phosphotransferase subunit DhaM [Evansella tamaricis]
MKNNNVSILLISHCYEIVSGLKNLLNQVQPDVNIAISGGIHDEIGTNAFDIKNALESVYTSNGVVILFDLGSALINAELAVEMFGGNKKIIFADAPLVEGAYAAVVESGLGNTVEEVANAAESAKQLQKISD